MGLSGGVKFKTRFTRLVMGIISASLLAGCIENTNAPGSKSNGSSDSSSSASGSLLTSETQCLIFKNNFKDYSNCLECKLTLCPCSEYYPNTNTCKKTDIVSCNANETLLVKCVHDNAVAAGGSCSGLKCGENQVADFTSCTCKDATPSSGGGAPGYEDTTTPYLEPGFFVGDRYCTAGPTTAPLECLQEGAYSGGGSSGTPPLYKTTPPANVLQDVGYIRWDLALDASQYSPRLPLDNRRPFYGSNSTLAATLSLYFKLKPNTVLSSSTVDWTDCPEHFSGYSAGSSHSTSSSTFCGTSSVKQTVTACTGNCTSGTVVLNDGPISLNGGATNMNMLDSFTTSKLGTNFGLAKQIGDFSGAGGAKDTDRTALISNIGYYKYSWGPVKVRRPSSATDLAAATVSGQIAMNTNLGYSAVSAVDSTAFTTQATGTLASRDCSLGASNSACVLTSVYRTSGGAVLQQSFAPQFTSNTSSISTLPSSITAVSTPKIIDDVSQLSVDDKLPARLRVFVRAADGNIYMSRGEKGQWTAWTSLGRPWLSEDSIQANIASGGAPWNSPVYWPYNNSFAQNIGPTYAAYDGVQDNGISIASEPVVASYMDTSVSPHVGYIAIFVRVSHLKSDGTPGIYHNAVFYTFAKASNALPISGTALDFDNISNWHRWMPVRNGTTLFQIQGNPLAMINKTVADADGANPIIYLFGTNAQLGAGTWLHPPVANYVNSGTAYPAFSGTWSNYGNSLIRTSLGLGCLTGTSCTVIPASAAVTGPLNWKSIASQSVAAGGVIVSDWSFSSTTASDTIRVYASELYAASFPFGGTSDRSPGAYSRQLHFFEYQFDSGQASGLAALCPTRGGYYFRDLNNAANTTTYPTSHSFYGTTSAVSLSSLSTTQHAQDTSGGNWTDMKTFLFGRALCPKGKCENVNPTAAFATVADAPLCNGASEPAGTSNGNIYYSGIARQGSTYTQSKTVSKIYPLLVTSDVQAFTSSALKSNGNDIPVYLLTRDANGRIAHGYWGTKNNGSGNRYFQFITTGGYSN